MPAMQIIFVNADDAQPGDQVFVDLADVERWRAHFEKEIALATSELRQQRSTFSERTLNLRHYLDELERWKWTPERTVLIKRYAP